MAGNFQQHLSFLVIQTMPRSRTLLLTGFGPFPGVPVNASSALVARIAAVARPRLSTVTIATATLPTEWRRGPDRVRALIARLRPEIVIHFGVAEQARGFVIERVGANACLAYADAAGVLPPLTVLDADGPLSRPVTLPVSAIVRALEARGLPVAASDDAGSYLCNAVLYSSLSLATERARPFIAGFVHIPPALDGGPLSFEQAVEGGLVIIETCLASKETSILAH